MARQPNRHHQEVRQAIDDDASFDTPYVVMNALAAVVASYGLLTDSAAVVIGAMVIAALLGPITGIALAMVDGNNALLRKALSAEIAGVVIVLAISLAVGRIHREIPLGREILARTSPNILDLMIALAGGAAGAYASVSPRVSARLVGVAIATALVPPLSTCGICLARGDTRLALGGFLLFLANLVAIQFASSVVLGLQGYHRITQRPTSARSLLLRNGLSLVLLLALGTVLAFNLERSVAAQKREAEMRERLTTALRAYPGSRLADLRIEPEQEQDVVIAVVRAPYSFAPQQVAAMEAQLPKSHIPVVLHVRSVLTKETTREGYLHELPAREDGSFLDGDSALPRN